MKKVSVLLVLLIVMASSTVYALDWAYPFGVWNGKVYEVKVEEVIEENEIGKVIGKVKTKPNDILEAITEMHLIPSRKEQSIMK